MADMSRQLATAQCAQRWKLGGQAFHEAQVLPCRSLSSPLSSDCGLLLLFTQSCLTVCDPMDCSMPGFPDLHRLPEPAQTHVHWSVMHRQTLMQESRDNVISIKAALRSCSSGCWGKRLSLNLHLGLQAKWGGTLTPFYLGRSFQITLQRTEQEV